MAFDPTELAAFQSKQTQEGDLEDSELGVVVTLHDEHDDCDEKSQDREELEEGREFSAKEERKRVDEGAQMFRFYYRRRFRTHKASESSIQHARSWIALQSPTIDEVAAVNPSMDPKSSLVRGGVDDPIDLTDCPLSKQCDYQEQEQSGSEEIHNEDYTPSTQNTNLKNQHYEDCTPSTENSPEKQHDGDFQITGVIASTSPTRSKEGSSKKSGRKQGACRELMNLTSFGYFSDIENHDPFKALDLMNTSFTVRKRRKIQKDVGTTGGSADRSMEVKALTTYSTSSLNKETHPRWRDVNIEGTEPSALIGCRCKVFWPMDKEWYTGVIKEFDSQTGAHHVDYDDGDKEEIVLAKEVVKLFLSQDEMASRNIRSTLVPEGRKKLDYQEMAALATGLEDFQEEFGHGEIVWAKLKGHPMWPAFVMDEKYAASCGLDMQNREGTLAVQFFGSYEHARISAKQAVSFSGGLLSRLYSKCKKVTFDRALEEAERYLKEGKLPDTMSKLQEELLDQSECATNSETTEEDQDFMGDERTHKKKKSIESLFTFPIKTGGLTILSLGKIVKDSERFHDEHHIWPEGYIVVRKFSSTKDPSKLVDYRMEVVKDATDKSRPLFRVKWSDGEQVEASNPTGCWKKIYQKLDKAKERSGEMSSQKRRQVSSGDAMFGFTNPQISKLIQALPYARVCSKFTGWFDKATIGSSEQLLPAGYKVVEVDWKHADKCNVCYLDEEYVNNLFLQCDKCRILVHMHCYGESEPPNGHLWLCQLCRPGAPTKTPLCCLCPIQGGAMKKTVDGRWAHLTCAMWIPETCLVDIKNMEPIDGIKSINKERWKLTCSICKVPYGACIQCSESSCRVAYHVLCARSAGFVLEVLEDSSNKANGFVEDFDEPVRLLSYCKRHRQQKEDRDVSNQHVALASQPSGDGFDHSFHRNISGCARTEPYNCAARRGRQEPEVRAAASLKRLYVEKRPYHVGGFSRRDANGTLAESKLSVFTFQVKNLQPSRSAGEGELKVSMFEGNRSEPAAAMVGPEDSLNVLSVSERYQQMRASLKHRLTFGKSSIHGWGVFTKKGHRAGDMVIEYAGETVRPVVADLRERSIYNSLVGAGTYMFRIDDERVVDATRAGSIAHLINHSCEPNCFSRVVTINGEEHIIIFAKRDIELGEELSYDYRFTSKGEQLDCHCGFPSCRGFVNADDAEEEHAKILVPLREVTSWTLGS